MSKILKSGIIVLAVATIAGIATYSYFSDTETSTGNTFTAGAIDLKIDNESYVSNQTDGTLIASSSTSWLSRDLTTVEKFFNFSDLKPGDRGEDTISFDVDSNPAWVCAEISLTSNKDNSCTEPEKVDDPNCSDPNGDGELAQSINFMWWPDDGDNVLEADERDNAFFLGPKDIAFLMNQGTTDNPANGKLELTLADKHVNFFDKTAPGTPVDPSKVYYVGKGWCFGNMLPNPVTQDGKGKTGDNGPLVRGTGFTCDGSQVNNASQTDSLTADLKFTAIQSRNNMNYHCPDDFHANN